ncbi:hypothetical protein DFQ28_001748 [Apophysomyces sp. BC1034]|nr:hypothetical protein DFQ30_007470 [Apophysomyces sp. BC1015]KAG0190633.1 hypothetical protein DFQ28_001748 [Apophysomyces sp. BC1034]
MTTFGARLREERKRLGFTQAKFAAIIGIRKNAQTNYEGDLRCPDSKYFVKVAEHGVDVQYVVTGSVSSVKLSPAEQALLTGFRALDAKGQVAVLALIGEMAQPQQPTTTMNFHGDVGQQVHGNVTYTQPVTMNVGGARKKREK